MSFSKNEAVNSSSVSSSSNDQSDSVSVSSLDSEFDSVSSYTFTHNAFTDTYRLTELQASLSSFLTNLMEMAKNANETNIDLSSISGLEIDLEANFNLVCVYLIHHNGVPVKLVDQYEREKSVTPDLKKLWGDWDIAFIDRVYKSMKDLRDLAALSNYIGCDGLLQLAISKIATYLKPLPIKSLRAALYNDTPRV